MYQLFIENKNTEFFVFPNGIFMYYLEEQLDQNEQYHAGDAQNTGHKGV